MSVDLHHRQRELRHFLLLDHEQQREAIQRLAMSGMSDHTIAAATALSVEQVRIILGERASQ
jgi:DNA-directed RNA polymerase specialized sigma24 family protein